MFLIDNTVLHLHFPFNVLFLKISNKSFLINSQLKVVLVFILFFSNHLNDFNFPYVCWKRKINSPPKNNVEFSSFSFSSSWVLLMTCDGVNTKTN